MELHGGRTGNFGTRGQATSDDFFWNSRRTAFPGRLHNSTLRRVAFAARNDIAGCKGDEVSIRTGLYDSKGYSWDLPDLPLQYWVSRHTIPSHIFYCSRPRMSLYQRLSPRSNVLFLTDRGITSICFTLRKTLEWIPNGLARIVFALTICTPSFPDLARCGTTSHLTGCLERRATLEFQWSCLRR